MSTRATEAAAHYHSSGGSVAAAVARKSAEECAVGAWSELVELPPSFKQRLNIVAQVWGPMVAVWGGFGPDHTVPSTLRPLTGTYSYILPYVAQECSPPPHTVNPGWPMRAPTAIMHIGQAYLLQV